MIHVDEFISCDEDGNEVAELLTVISLTCCNPNGWKIQQLSGSEKRKPTKNKKQAFPKKFCLGILLSLMNELFTELEKSVKRKKWPFFKKKFIYLFIFGCFGSSLLCAGFF